MGCVGFDDEAVMLRYLRISALKAESLLQTVSITMNPVIQMRDLPALIMYRNRKPGFMRWRFTPIFYTLYLECGGCFVLVSNKGRAIGFGWIPNVGRA